MKTQNVILSKFLMEWSYPVNELCRDHGCVQCLDCQSLSALMYEGSCIILLTCKRHAGYKKITTKLCSNFKTELICQFKFKTVNWYFSLFFFVTQFNILQYYTSMRTPQISKLRSEIITRTYTFSFLFLYFWVFRLCMCGRWSVHVSACPYPGQRHHIPSSLSHRQLLLDHSDAGNWTGIFGRILCAFTSCASLQSFGWISSSTVFAKVVGMHCDGILS